MDGVAPPGDEDVDHRAAAPGDVGREDDDSEDPLDQLFGTDVNDDANANGQDGEEEDIPCPNDTDGDAVENEDDEADEQPNSSDYSFNKGGSALRTSFANEDIAGFEGHRFAFVFEGSGYTAGNGSVPGSVPGLSSVANGDLFDFRPRSLGASSAGTWALNFDSSEVGLTGEKENRTAAAFARNGAVYAVASRDDRPKPDSFGASVAALRGQANLII